MAQCSPILISNTLVGGPKRYQEFPFFSNLIASSWPWHVFEFPGISTVLKKSLFVLLATACLPPAYLLLPLCCLPTPCLPATAILLLPTPSLPSTATATAFQGGLWLGSPAAADRPGARPPGWFAHARGSHRVDPDPGSSQAPGAHPNPRPRGGHAGPAVAAVAGARGVTSWRAAIAHLIGLYSFFGAFALI